MKNSKQNHGDLGPKSTNVGVDRSIRFPNIPPSLLKDEAGKPSIDISINTSCWQLQQLVGGHQILL